MVHTRWRYFEKVGRRYGCRFLPKQTASRPSGRIRLSQTWGVRKRSTGRCFIINFYSLLQFVDLNMELVLDVFVSSFWVGVFRHFSAFFGIFRHFSAFFGIFRHFSAFFNCLRYFWNNWCICCFKMFKVWDEFGIFKGFDVFNYSMFFGSFKVLGFLMFLIIRCFSEVLKF